MLNRTYSASSLHLMKTLAEIYSRYTAPFGHGDKGSDHSYIEVYAELLAPYRHTAKLVLEIGIMAGLSLRMWEEYFTAAEVHGVDLCDRPHGGFADLRPMLAEGTHHISFLDATDEAQVMARFGQAKFDVVIEDASHALAHQLAIYRNFRTLMAPGGIYVVEDVAGIDCVRPVFERMDPTKQIHVVDRRKVKGRADDVLVVVTDP